LLAVVIMGASSFAFLNLISRVHDVHTGIDLAKRFPLFFAVEYVALWIISRYQLAAAIKGRERVARRAMRKFYRRWLGLWAPNDEAILSLRHLSSCAEGHYEALCSGRSLAGHSTEPALNEWWSPSSLNLRLSSPRLTVDVLAEGGIVRLSSLLTPAYWFYNRLIAPRLASAISAALVRLAQGSDTPGAVLAYCSPCPVPITDLPPGLPEHVADSLEAEVASALGIAAPTIREMIIRSALNGASPVAATGLPRPGGSGALVHTAYFANADVLGLIAAHIVWGREGVDGKAAPTSSDRAHLWIKGNKEAVALVWAEHENRVGSHTGLRARCLCERCDI
jgi:hypothetical protein